MRYVRVWRELVPLAAIVLVAAFFRVYMIGELPPALHGDEAYKGIQALRVLRGEVHPIYFEESWGGVEPLYIYLVAIFFRLFGATPLVLRLVSVGVGILTVPALYLLVRELFSSSSMGLLAASWLAISYWHINYSRLGWEIILSPLLAVLAFYFLWRGLRSNRSAEFLWAGLFLGVGLYTYQAMRFLPLVLLLFLGYRVLMERSFIETYGPNLLLLFGLSLLIFAPLGHYFLTHPDVFLRRAREVSLFNPAKNPWSPWQAMIINVGKIIGMFTLRGDPNWRHNLAGRPALDILSSFFFLLGLWIAFARRKEPVYLFLLLWLIVMALPPVLTAPIDVPHFSRSIGALPVACIFPAVGAQGAWAWVRSRKGSPVTRRFLGASTSFLLVLVSVSTFRDYFMVWGHKDGLRYDYFDGGAVDATTAMNQMSDARGVWILPINALAEPYAEPFHYTIDFLYRGEAPHRFLCLDEETASDELFQISQGRTRAFLLNWKGYTLEEAYKYIDADPKGLVAFLLSKYGRLVEKREFEGFDVEIYELPASPYFAIADSFEPLSINFENQIELMGVSYGGSSLYETSTPSEAEKKVLPSGKSGWVVLRWRGLKAMAKDYKAGVYLKDGRGRLIGQMDKLLLSNYLRPTSHWEPSQMEMDYYTLPSLTATPPGEYHIEVAVYDEETLTRLPLVGKVSGLHTAKVGTLQVIEPLLPPLVEPQVELEVEIAPGIRLLGYDIGEGVVAPGDMIHLTLYWEALQRVERDYLLSLELRDEGSQVWGKKLSRPVDGRYPTMEWDKGEVLRDWHDMLLEAEAPPGDYAIHLGVLEGDGIVGEADLGTLEVWGRAHSFVVPEMGCSLEATLGQAIELLGYDLSPDVVKPGDVLRLTLYWQALGEMEKSYTVFTHLIDEGGRVWGQRDSIPGSGTLATTGWVKGEIITDEYELAVDPEAPAGTYLVEVGMYLAETAERLPVYSIDGELLGDRILLPSGVKVTR